MSLRQQDTSTCEHDWRVDPWQILLTMPPQQRLVCAKCHAISSRTTPGHQQPSRNPKDWQKA